MVYFADAAGLSFGVVRRDPVGGGHVAFASRDRATVDEFYEAAIAAGGRDNGEPGLRPEYGESYYAGYVHDADGNNIEAVCQKPM
jgi:catechol 2,3-dioxygenase-like lactoylglutathione lyase family enzyme